MKVSDSEGLANHTGPESCVVGGDGYGEALTGERAGRVLCHKTRRTRGDSLKRIIEDLNPILRGWFAYFKHALSWTFRLLDGFIRRRLRSLLRKQQKRPGFGDVMRTISAGLMLSSPNRGFSPYMTPLSWRANPDVGKPTGEPCAGEPPTRFGGRGGR